MAVKQLDQRVQAPQLKPGTYSDGHPLDDVHYLQCKLILKPDRFVSPSSFDDYACLVHKAAQKHDIEFSTQGFKEFRPKIREVVFFDTKDFSLYNHGFILRRRITYEHGFPVGEPEIVFKFRHPDLQTAAEMDMRPKIPEYRIKFKAEALPLKEKLGGYRLLYSHNVVFGLNQVPEVDRPSLAALVNFFPVLATLPPLGAKKLNLVNHTIVEEVRQDLGELNFGKGVVAESNASLWRQRGDHRSLIGEFSYECRFRRRDELHEKAVERCKRFFITLQEIGGDWVSLGATKTGVVYRLKGTPPHAHD